MTELFGDPKDFAIEAEIEPDLHTIATVWGHMCVWCRGIALGDIGNQYCGLYHAYYEFGRLATEIDGLWAEEFSGLDDVAAWNFLDGKLYGFNGDVELQDDRTLEECLIDSTRWGRFNFLTNWGEQFDGFKSFLISPPGGLVKILSRRLPDYMGRSVLVSRDRVVEAADGFSRWFEAQSQMLGIPCQRPGESNEWPKT